MKSLRSIAIRLFKANRMLITTSIISIIIGTMLILTMLMYSMNAQYAMKQSFKDMYGDVDIRVSYDKDQPYVLTKEKIDQLLALPQIEQSAQVLYTHLNFDDVNISVYTVGTTSNDLTKSSYKFTSDITPSSIILNQELARFMGVSVGDEISVEGITLHVAEIITDSVNDISIAIIHPSHLQPFMKTGEQAKGLMIKLVEGTEPLLVVEQLKRIDAELRIDVQEESEVVVMNMRTLHIFIVVLSVLVAVITSLLILSNYEIILYKLRNQIAILRSIGATTKQISSIILFQSMVINLCGVGLGAILSFFGMNFLFQIAEQVFRLPPITDKISNLPMLAMTIACFIVFQLFMLIPAYRSTKILPLKINEDNEHLNFKHKKGKSRIGKVSTTLGLILYIVGYVFAMDSEGAYVIVFVGILLFFIGCLLLLPYVIEKILTGIFKLAGRKLGSNVYLAMKNMLPQVKRNTLSVMSISFIMIIAIFGSTLFSTLEANNNQFLYEHYESPIMLHNRLVVTSQINPNQLREELLQFDSIRDVYFESRADLKYIMKDNGNIQLHVVAGTSSLVDGLQQDELVISKDIAGKHHLQVGDVVTIGYFDVEEQNILPLEAYRIGKVSDELDGKLENTVIAWASPLNDYATFNYMYINTYNDIKALEDLKNIRSKYPELQVKSLSEALEQAQELFFQRWAIFIVVFIVVIGSTMVGVINSLINNILSKRKEFAVLRAIGVAPKGIIHMILAQVILFIGMGIIVGCLIGVILVALVIMLEPTLIRFNIPIIGLTSISMLLISSIIFIVIGRYLTIRDVPQEITIDGK